MTENGYPGNPGNDTGPTEPPVGGPGPNGAGEHPATDPSGGADPHAGAAHGGGYAHPDAWATHGAGYADPNAGHPDPAGGFADPGPRHGPPGEGVRQPGGDEPPVVPVATYASGLRIGDAVGFGFRAFGRAPLPWIGWTVLLGAAMVVVTIAFGAMGAFGGALEANDVGDFDDSVGFGMTMTPSFLSMTLLLSLVVGVVMALTLRGALEQVDGRRLAFGDFLRIDNWGSIVLGALLLAGIDLVLQIPLMIAPVAGLFATALISLLLGPFYVFLMHFIVDRRMSPVDALKANVAVVKRNYLPVLGLTILTNIVLFVGAVLCVVGLVVAAPAATLMTVHAYRQVSEGRRPIDAIA